jgi:hypothetical protein
MRKRPSKRRMKARLMIGRWISREDLLNYRLDVMIARRGLKMGAQYHSDYWRRVA